MKVATVAVRVDVGGVAVAVEAFRAAEAAVDDMVDGRGDGAEDGREDEGDGGLGQYSSQHTCHEQRDAMAQRRSRRRVAFQSPGALGIGRELTFIAV